MCHPPSPPSSEKVGVRAGAWQGHSKRGSQITRSKLHPRSVLPRLASQRSDGQLSQWKVEDVHGLHGPKQGLPQGQLSSPVDWHLGGLNSKILAAKFHGRFLWIQPNQAEWGRSREDFICHQLGSLLLQSEAIQTQEHERYISKVDEQNVRSSYWKECASLRGRHAGKKHSRGQPLQRPLRDLRHPSVLQHEIESKQVCVRGDDRKIPRIHGIPKGYWGQLGKDTGHNGVNTAKNS